MVKRQIFISDLHLDQSRGDITAAFESFLTSKCRDADELYILGDLFEVWLGDDDLNSFNTEIIHLLNECPATKFLMHGNRDFLLGQTFCEMTGSMLLPDPALIDLNGESALLMHGDSLCTGDTTYMSTRKLFRSAAFQQDFLGKSLTEREAFASQVRGESKSHTIQITAEIMDVTPSEVTRELAAHGVNLLIHGHTHRPGVHHIEISGKPATRYVLGDWRPQTWYLEVTDGKPALLQF